MKNALTKDTIRDIKKSFGRFISILSIVALGVAFFTGVKVSPIVMKTNADNYYDDNNLFDIRLISTLGITNSDIKEIKSIDGIKGIQPSYFNNFIAEYDSKESVIIAHSYPNNVSEENENYINRLTLVDGRMPNEPGECLVEYSKIEAAQVPIGTKLKLSTGTSQNIGDILDYDEYEVVGIVQTPYYLSYEKGTAPIGNGDISNFIMIPENDFKSSVFTEAFITIEGAEEKNSYKDSYFEIVDKVSQKLENISDERNQVRFEEVKREAFDKLEDGKQELYKNEKIAQDELDKAKATIDSARNDLIKGENKLKTEEQNYNKFINESEEKLKEGKNKLDEGEREYQEGLKIFNENKSVAEEELKKLDKYIESGEKSLIYLKNEKKKLEDIYNVNPTDQLKKQIEILEKVINESESALSIVKEQVETKKQQLKDAEKKLSDTRVFLDNSKVELSKQEKALADGKITALNEFKVARDEIEKGKIELTKGEKEYNAKKAEVEKELQIAREKIADSEKKINDIEKPEWIILDRSLHYSYLDYKNAADSIDALAAVFPVFFFLVAALVCLTTMTRMVDEQRVNIGTLKALGYSKGSIASKYIVYALSASLLGSLIGILIGFTVFPFIVFNAYGIMYVLPPVKLLINIPLALGATTVSVLVTTLSAMSACYKELIETPSVLMRPKAPKVGKRILVERIPFIWNKFNFIGKVTVRNIFRYKKRFFMTVFGIAGCTALLLTGFGIKDSIKTIVDKQFGSIFIYNTSISLDDNIVDTQKLDINTMLEKDSRVEDYIYISSQNGKLIDDDKVKNVTIIIPENITELDKFISLHERISGENIKLSNEGVVISEKVANQLDINIGDEIKLKDKNDKEKSVKVTGVVENYVSHYVYMTKEYYENIFGKSPEFLSIYIDNDESLQDEVSFSKDILSKDGVVGVNFTSTIKNTFDDTIRSLNLVVIVLIVSAGALAFVVLYNLTNVNISERMREIATIKVLGFYDSEVSAYIYRENIILTLIGAFSGLGLGIILHRFIMVTVELEDMMFGRSIDSISFILSILLTLGFSLLVNLAMYYKLKNVQMVESLKSVD